MVGFVNGPNGPDSQVGGVFDIDTGKRLEEQDLQDALRNSTFKIIRTPNASSDPSSIESQEKIAPIAVWYDESGNLVTFGVPAEDATP